MSVRGAVTKILSAAVILVENLRVIDRAKQRTVSVLKQISAACASRANVVSGALTGANPAARHFSARRSAHCVQQMFALDGRFAVVRIDQITLLRAAKSGTIHAEQITGCVQCVTKSVKFAGSAEWRPHIWRRPRCRSFPMHQQHQQSRVGTVSDFVQRRARGLVREKPFGVISSISWMPRTG